MSVTSDSHDDEQSAANRDFRHLGPDYESDNSFGPRICFGRVQTGLHLSSVPLTDTAYTPYYNQSSITSGEYPQSLARLPTVFDTSTLQPGHQGFRERLLRSLQENDDSQLSIIVRGSTELGSFLDIELEPSDELLDLVVLTGSARFPWATTCDEYVSAVWPDHSSIIKDVFKWIRSPDLDAAFGKSKRLPCDLDAMGIIEISLLPGEVDCFTKDGLAFRMECRPKQCAPIIEALSWLCSTLRTSHSGMLEESVLELEHDETFVSHDFKITAAQTVAIADAPNDCWMPIVLRAITATDFPVPSRHPSMQGMEVSFNLLCFLCGIEYETLEGEGTVLFGERSVVYPVRYKFDSVQWHFEHREPLTPGSPERGLPNARLMTTNIRRLREAKRHFLGLWADPRITLGTTQSTLSDITWSRLPEVKHELKEGSVTIGGSITLPKLGSLTLNKTYEIAKSRKSIYQANFEQKMFSLIDIPAILYCPSERRCWMVPYVSVILHLARARAEEQKALGIQISPCELVANGGEAAFAVIQSYCYSSLRDEWLGADERRK